jgi:tetratricopeptide (TPR) repeat protein
MVTRRYGPVVKAMAWPHTAERPKPDDVPALQSLAARFPDSFPVQMAAGQALAATGASGASGAISAFERAATLVPWATGSDSPRAQLAELAERGGDAGRATRELAQLLAYDHTNVEAARKLVQTATRSKDDAALALGLDRIVTADPFDARAHTALGQWAAARGDLPVALREFEVALKVRPVDPAGAHCDFGEALLAAGRRADAKREALAALEIAPSFARAQELLLKSIEGGEPQH